MKPKFVGFCDELNKRGLGVCIDLIEPYQAFYDAKRNSRAEYDAARQMYETLRQVFGVDATGAQAPAPAPAPKGFIVVTASSSGLRHRVLKESIGRYVLSNSHQGKTHIFSRGMDTMLYVDETPEEIDAQMARD